MGEDELKKLENKDFGDEKFIIGSECLYLYLPRDASPKRLNTNYLEKQLSITMTMRRTVNQKRFTVFSGSIINTVDNKYQPYLL